MHPRIREIIDTVPYTRATMRQAGQFLPADNAELDEWLGETVAKRQSLDFFYLVCASLDLGRPVSSRHLAHGLQLLPQHYLAGCLTMHASGEDVPEQVLQALLHGGISPLTHAGLLVVVAEWCKERDRPVPEEFGMGARIEARKPAFCPETVALLAAFGSMIGDGRIVEIIARQTRSAGAQSELVKVGMDLAKILLKICRAPLINLVRDVADARDTGFTVRRSVEHIGRNEACPCGSGKKYKRCCFEKDQQRLQLCTDIAGKTYAEVQADYEEHLTPARLEKTPPHDLARLDPEKMDPDLHVAFIDRLGRFEMKDEAVAALEKTGYTEELDETWDYILLLAVRGDRKDLVERLIALRGNSTKLEDMDLHPGVNLMLVRENPAESLNYIEELANIALTSKDPREMVRFAFGMLYSRRRALSIVIARAMLPLIPKNDAVVLLDLILETRDLLDLSPDELFSDILDKRFAEEGVAGGGKDTEALRLARQKLEAKAGEVRQMKHALEQLKSELERREKAPPPKAVEVSTTPAPTVDEKALKELREKVSALKTDLKQRHTERAELRRELSRTLTDLETLREAAAKAAPQEAPAPVVDAEDRLLLPGDVDGNQPLRMIEFPKKFQQTLEKFPRQVGRGAMALLGRLAGGEPAAFVGVVRLKDCPETLRARVGIDHRLLFRLQPDCVQVVDLINRRDLEKRIKTL